MHYALSNHSSTEGHLGCFQTFAIVNKASVITWIWVVFLCIQVFIFLGWVSRSAVAGSDDSFSRTFQKIFSSVGVLSNPHWLCMSNSVFCILASFWCYQYFLFSLFDHTVDFISIPYRLMMLTILPYSYCHPHLLHWNVSLVHFRIGLLDFPTIEFREFFIHFKYQYFFRYCLSLLAFTLSSRSFQKAKISNLD
jgi:hypothetical protein